MKNSTKQSSLKDNLSKYSEERQYSKNSFEEVEDNTGFWFGQNEDGVRIHKGNYIVSKMVFETIEEAEEYLDSKPWEIIQAISYGMAMGAIMERERQLREELREEIIKNDFNQQTTAKEANEGDWKQ